VTPGPVPEVPFRGRQNDANTERSVLFRHEWWKPRDDGLLEEQNATGEPDLVPVRHWRMMVSPFTFYRGAAKDHGS